MGGRISRRRFMAGTAGGLAALAATRTVAAGVSVPDSARVWVVHHPGVCPVENGYRPADPDIVRAMVRAALIKMHPGRSVADIVAGWCPSGKTPATARIKIKFAGTRGLFPCHPGVINGVVRLLVDDGGVRPENIHVYENCPKNFGEADRPPIFGTPFAGGKNREPGVVYSQLGAPDGTDMPNANHRETIRLDCGNGQTKEYTFHFWDGLQNDTDILINIPALKRHIGPPKFTTTTIAMKNHYGSIRDPYRQHGTEIGEKIAALNAARVIRAKEKLVVVDALYAMYSQGPERGRMKYGLNKLLVSSDPVAADYVGWGMLNEMEPCAEPREIMLAARNGVGFRADRWQDHAAELEM
ncbi:MAG: DUF362 domain-containing protein [Candidatus Sumerlaeia bacterium]|nr:DUF362 domain-containing protein [Candidatus Sumerlaeia bacterium]